MTALRTSKARFDLQRRAHRSVSSGWWQAALPLPTMSSAQMDTLAAQSQKMLEELEEKSGELDPNLLEAA